MWAKALIIPSPLYNKNKSQLFSFFASLLILREKFKKHYDDLKYLKRKETKAHALCNVMIIAKICLRTKTSSSIAVAKWFG